MNIFFEEKTGTFHLTNKYYSYIMKILENHQMGQLYFGKAVRHRESFDSYFEIANRGMAACVFEGNISYSMEHIKQEYPAYGTGDYRHPAVRVKQENGSYITDFVYDGHKITAGKPALEGLPATYCEEDSEAMTLHIFLKDALTGVTAELLYTVFEDVPALARSVRFENKGEKAVALDTAMSMNLDLPDNNYEFVQLSGAWARERFVYSTPLRPGIQSVESLRGHSSPNNNPFMVLKRPGTDEHRGEALGFSLIYSGNFLAQAEVDSWNVTRASIGINPFGFKWKLAPGTSFQTPEAVLVYSDQGLNFMSQSFHKLYGKRLARGVWRDKARPILINNWEATYFDFTEDKLVGIASQAKELGVEMFVLDDGWFGRRTSDRAGLGDWVPNKDRLANGITGLAERIDDMGMLFGLWFEPEMVNKDSDLYRAHPEWALQTPGRHMTHGRNQYVLDFSRKDVVDHIYNAMYEILANAKVSYIKWDMNRSITEAYSALLSADQQGEVMHRYILGLYDLYDRLNKAFPNILFESCASGGGRFDPGLLYYAPQAWTSDCTDSVQRLKIQYGTSFWSPISSIGAHVSKSPNEQLFRSTPLKTRGNVACFGTFGYEMDLQLLSEEEKQEVAEQIKFMKEYRELLQFGTFYRLLSPFEGDLTSWMVVSADQKTAIVGYYKTLNEVNGPFRRVALKGLNPNLDYSVNGKAVQGGDELMNIGLITTDSAAGECHDPELKSCDFDSRLYILKAE